MAKYIQNSASSGIPSKTYKSYPSKSSTLPMYPDDSKQEVREREATLDRTVTKNEVKGEQHSSCCIHE